MRYLFDQDLDFPLGFYAQSDSWAIKKSGKPDTAILYSTSPANWGGVFTNNLFRSYSIQDALLKAKKKVQLLSVFSGNANTCTGKSGKDSVENLTNVLAERFALTKSQVLVSFTGLIGIPFPQKTILKHFQTKTLPFLFQESGEGISTSDKPGPFYEGILTTDTRPKKIAVEIPLKQGRIRLSACAKGAGMIAPNMATMLSFMTTDLKMSHLECRQKVRDSLPTSFNAISVDGDCSTNDSVFFIANGASRIEYKKLPIREQKKIDEAIKHAHGYLAKEIVRDGEGATKIIAIKVSGAPDNESALILSRSVGQSLLVKTAMFGNDPNYGRILMALGNAGVPIKLNQVRLRFGKTLLYAQEKLRQNKLAEISKYLRKNKEIVIDIEVGKGKGQQVFYTCDISYDYVKINAEYTT